MAKPGSGAAAAIAARRGPQEFNADERTKAREDTPVIVGGSRYKRRRKDWDTNRAMRAIMREQEKSVALSTRLRRRIIELEADQMEAAAKGEAETETALESTIEELITKADEATETAELASYKLVATLLQPADGQDDALEGDELVEALKSAMDVEDVAELASTLAGSAEPDPQATQESEAT